MKTDQEKTPRRDPRFFERTLKGKVANLGRCYQCSACSDCCPMAYAMDCYPHQLLHLARLGFREKVLTSNTLWLCVSCWRCNTRCPNEIDIVHFMDALRQEALREGLGGPAGEVPRFHQLFLEALEKRGRIDELSLLLRFKIKTFDLRSWKKLGGEAGLGLKMFLRGKLKFLPSPTAASAEVEAIFQKILKKPADR